MTEAEGVEIQVLPHTDDGNGECKSYRCLVVPKSPISDSRSKSLANKTATHIFDDASTARTDNLTEVDDMTSLHERLTYTFTSPATSFEAIPSVASTDRVRYNQRYLMSIDELNDVTREQKIGDCQENCLLDNDDDTDDDECSTGGGFKPVHQRLDHPSYFEMEGTFVGGSVLQSDSRLSFYDGPSFAHTPASMAGHNSESRAQFYGGYSHSNIASYNVNGGNKLDDSLSHADFFNNGPARPNSTSAGSSSMFAEDTLKTDSRIAFYSVACSDTVEEPLSCREKVVQVRLSSALEIDLKLCLFVHQYNLLLHRMYLHNQPALSCDEDFFNTNQTREEIISKRTPQKKKNSSYNEQSRSDNSFFKVMTCCFMPTDP